jgi:hypothetical protein
VIHQRLALGPWVEWRSCSLWTFHRTMEWLMSTYRKWKLMKKSAFKFTKGIDGYYWVVIAYIPYYISKWRHQNVDEGFPVSVTISSHPWRRMSGCWSASLISECLQMNSLVSKSWCIWLGGVMGNRPGLPVKLFVKFPLNTTTTSAILSIGVNFLRITKIRCTKLKFLLMNVFEWKILSFLVLPSWTFGSQARTLSSFCLIYFQP